MENKKTENKKTENKLTFSQQTAKGLASANDFFKMLRPSNIKDIFTATKAVEMLKTVDNKTDLTISKVCEKVKNAKLYANMSNPNTGKMYKSYNEWAVVECGLEKAQANNYVLIACLIDDNGKDILPRINDDKKINYTASALREILFAIKCDIKDENAKLAEKVNRAKHLAEMGYIRPIQSVKELREKIAKFQNYIEMGVLTWEMNENQITTAINEYAKKMHEEESNASAPTDNESAPTENDKEKAQKHFDGLKTTLESAYKARGENLPQTLKNYFVTIAEYIAKL